MTEVGPKSPRLRDPTYLAWLRTQVCRICGTQPSDACHVRASSLAHSKRETGKGEKPSDCWALPLCRGCHIEQHKTNELRFWQSFGINPFDEAILYYTRAFVLKETAPTYSKPKPRKITSRGFQKSTRKIQSRGFQ